MPTVTTNESTNVTTNVTTGFENTPDKLDIVMILSTAIASIGIMSNLTVVVVFLKHKKLRIKIPNIFIINQVSLIRKCFNHSTMNTLMFETVLLKKRHG